MLEARRAGLLKANKWSPAAYETFRASAAKRRGGVHWTLARRLMWGSVFGLVFAGLLRKWIEDERKTTGMGADAGMVLGALILGALITVGIYFVKRAVNRWQDGQVAAVEAVDADIAALRERIAEKTQLADA